MDDEDDDDAEDRGRSQPLDRREAASVRRDLEDLDEFKRVFAPEGFKGVSLFCADCVEEHYYGWDMLEGNLQALLSDGETPVHEPAFDPRPEDYVNWDYAQGYLDGQSDADTLPIVALEGPCPYCDRPMGDAPGFCPSCGHDLGIVRMIAALAGMGWSPDEVSELLSQAQVRRPGARRRP